MSYQRSPLEATKAARRRHPGLALRAAGNTLVDKLLLVERPGPVSPDAKELGEFVVAQMDTDRIKRAVVRTARPISQSSTLERRFDTFTHGSVPGRPNAHTTLRLTGKDFGQWSSRGIMGENIFDIEFNVYALTSGARMLQAFAPPYTNRQDPPPAEHEVALSALASREAALEELFDNSHVSQLDRVNFAMLDTRDSELLELRPFNERAFGTDILTILRHISGPDQPSMDISIENGYIEQFSRE